MSDPCPRLNPEYIFMNFDTVVEEQKLATKIVNHYVTGHGYLNKVNKKRSRESQSEENHPAKKKRKKKDLEMF